MPEYHFIQKHGEPSRSVEMAWPEHYIKAWLRLYGITTDEITKPLLKKRSWGYMWTPKASRALMERRTGGLVLAEMPCLEPGSLDMLKVKALRFPSGDVWSVERGLIRKEDLDRRIYDVWIGYETTDNLGRYLP